jgi:hypothetical protein
MDDDCGSPPDDFSAWLGDPSLTDGQKRRLRVFHGVENSVSARIEQLCAGGDLDVMDVAVLVVAPTAQEIFFGGELGAGTSVILGHRSRIHAFLCQMLPAAPDAPFDPYADLLEPAPVRCVRVLVIDDESLTVMSYGTFVTVRLGNGQAAEA